MGNPGAQYENTPHSVGFEVLDAFAAEIGAVWEEKKAFKAMLAAGAAVLYARRLEKTEGAE